jgi:hypothetical protein
MITISAQVLNVSGSNLFGAMGGDVTVRELQSVVGAIKYLTARSLLIEENTRTVVADSGGDYVAQTTPTPLRLYDDVRSPRITDQTWAALKAAVTESGSRPGLVERDGYYFAVQYLTTGDGGVSAATSAYVLVSAVKVSDVLATSDSITSDIQAVIRQYILVTCLVFAAVLILVLAVTAFFTNRLVAPLVRMVHSFYFICTA